MIYSSGSGDIECHRLKLAIMGHFLPSPLKPPPTWEFWKYDKNCGRYHHFTQVYQNPQSCEVQFLRYGVRQTGFFVILGHFLHLYLLTNRKTMKKASWNVIITLHMCTKNHNHMIYASTEIWNMTDIIFCHFGLFFALIPY